MVWRGSTSRPLESDIFTQKLWNHYSPLSGFNWEDADSRDSPQINDNGGFADNHLARVNQYITEVLDEANHYRTNHVLTLMGEDFTYKPTSVWYENMDKLIHYANLDGRINIFYSTPSIYTKSVNAAHKDWSDTLKTDDFFPYADNSDGYWSGYFTTRPNFKRMERRASNLMQAARQVEVASGGRVPEGHGNTLDNMERVMGISQHHDAITGNNKQAVADDYSQRLSGGMADGVNIMTERVGKLSSISDLCHCTLNNQTRCECTTELTSAGQAIKLAVYNPLSSLRNEVIQVPVNTANLKVIDNVTGKAVRAQVIPVSDATKNIPAETTTGLPAVNSFVLHFEANNLPAMGFSTYILQAVDSSDATKAPLSTYDAITAAFTLQAGSLTYHFDSNGFLTSVDLPSKQSVNVAVNFGYYKAYCGNGQHDGEYIFRPDGDSSIPLTVSSTKATLVKGDLVNEVHIAYNLASSVLRFRSGSDAVEVETTVNSIPIDDNVGKEIIIRYVTNLQTAGAMRADSNGREMLHRQRDHRDTWDLNLQTEQKVARNYFPVNAAASIKDANTQLTVLTDRSEGVASLLDGQIEFMLHRRLTCDDSRGAGEALNEGGPDGKGLQVRVSHVILMNDLLSAPVAHKSHQARVFATPVLLYSKALPLSQIIGVNALPRFSLLAAPLHPALSLITLQDLGNNRILLRLAHLYEAGEHKSMSVSVTVNLDSILPSLHIKKVTEMQLTGVKPKSSITRLDWGLKAPRSQSHVLDHLMYKDDKVVTVKPMEIKTFIIEI
jgi:alpha-mannosidase